MAISPRQIPWSEWRPDLRDLNTTFTSSILNVLPRADGYMPFNDYAALTDALPGACRGFFFARNEGAFAVFAGTETRLYQLDNTTLAWTDVSQGGSAYAALASDAQWQFVQFNNFVIAVQENEPPQAFDVTSDTEFADLSADAPNARYVSVVNRFLVLSGLTDDPYQVRWSALNDITNWITLEADSQDLPDGGVVRGVVGGEFGVIIQDLAMRRMVFAPGSDVIFQIDRISKDTGALAPYSIVNAGERVFFLSPRGFIMTDGAGAINPIGKERVDRFFLDIFDSAALRLVIGAADPSANQVFWSYKSRDGGIENQFDHLLCYDWVLDKWTPIAMMGEYLAPLARPGLTLESLDAIAPGAITITGAADNGSGLIRITVGSTATLTTGDVKTISGVTGTTEANGTWTITVISGTTFDLQGSTFANAYGGGGVVGGSLDDLTVSLDTFAVADLAQLAAASTDHTIGFFSGDSIEATLETSEQADLGFHTLVNGAIPLTDADEFYVSIAMRDTINGSATYGDESGPDHDGLCPVLEEGRYLRAKMRIPEAATWTYSTGIIPDTKRAGAR